MALIPRYANCDRKSASLTGATSAKPGLERLARPKPFALQDHFQRPPQADDARQPLRAAPAGQQTEPHFGQAELRVRPVEDEAVIAGQGKLETPAETGAVDRGQSRHGQRGELVEEALALGRQGLGRGGVGDFEEAVQVGAGEEAGRLAAADDEQRQPGLRGDGVEGGVEVGQHPAGDDVVRLAGHVDLEEGAAVAVLLDRDGFGLEEHGSTPWMPPMFGVIYSPASTKTALMPGIGRPRPDRNRLVRTAASLIISPCE